MRVDKPEAVKEILHAIKGEYEPFPNRYIRDSLVFWLLCTGVHLYNLGEIKTADVNRSTMQITTNGIVYDIKDKDIVTLIDDWCKCDYVETARFGPVYLYDCEYLLRPNVIDSIFSEKSDISTFIAAVSRVSNHYFDMTGKRITMSRIGVEMPRVFSDVVDIIEVEE